MVGFVLGLAKGSLGFLTKYWKWILIAAIVASVAFAINIMIRKYNDAIEDAVVAEQLAKDWEKKSNGWEKSFRNSEVLRQQETRQAIFSLESERNVCNQRVASALRTRERINTITRVVPNENNTICPAAGSITSDELRDALGAR